jgi:cytochrome c5
MRNTQRFNIESFPLRRLAAVLALALPTTAAAAGDRDGATIYKEKCASCHGPNGEGTPDGDPRPLAGDRSVKQLARLIARTMPEDDAGTCTGEDADRVAAFIYESFYSPTARERNRPARVELARLTVRQYRNAVADLVGSSRGPSSWGDERGLHAEYFKGRRYRGNERVIDRVDPELNFDFGEAGPEPEKFDPAQFSIRWEGSVLAQETGEHEFLLRTDQAARLWVNDLKRPLIDATVKSGNDTEYRGTLFLLAGRAYSVRLEFSKAKQGVDDSKKNKPKPVHASISLAWKPPGRAVEVIPGRQLSPSKNPEIFAPATAFPPDDRSVGYERGTAISKAWEAATTDGAVETADYVIDHLPELAGARPDDADRSSKLRDFARRFAERAFRRPLTAEEARVFVDRRFESADDPALALKKSLLLVLKSPRFLYRADLVGKGPFDAAARLSFALWDAPPDQALLDFAARGELSKPEQVRAQAERMLADPRARAKLRTFLHLWLRVDQVADLSKDRAKYPDFDDAAIADLRTSLDLFLDDVAWGWDPDFRRLLLAEEVYLNGRLAKLYGVDLPADAPFQRVRLEPGERAGVLTHPYILASFAYTASSSPIHRGVFLSRSVLGRVLRPPPEAVAPLAPDVHPSLTTRERVEVQTSPSACRTCHGMINPLGFALERFDAVGRLRAEERGKEVNATGGYQTRQGLQVTFEGARGLATFLAGSDETYDAFVEQLFHALVQQPAKAYGAETVPTLRKSFVAHGCDIRSLMVDIAATAALPPSPSE